MRCQAISLAVVSLAVACGGSEQVVSGHPVIDREVFIETFVDLRLAAARNEGLAISAGERDEILGRHRTDAEGLRDFADLHGRDVDFMSEAWSEVEARIEERSAPRDSV